MEVDRGEQRQIGFGVSGCQLRFCIVDISLDLFLQSLQRRKVFLMDACLGERIDFACYILMRIEIRRIKRFFRPVQDRLEN